MAAPVAARINVVEHFKVVFKRAHPRQHLFFFCARQKADFFTDAHRSTREDDFGKAPHIERLRQSSGKRNQRFARPRLT